MLRSLRIGLASLCLGVLFALYALAAPAAAKTIAVGVGINEGSGTISSKAPFTLVDAKGKKVPAKGSIRVSGGGRTLNVGGKPLVLPVTVSGKAPLVWDGKGYRGSLKLVPGGGGFNVVNVIDVEDYLRGLLKAEANPSWPQEALKAQAIVARTYAIRNAGRHASQGFDVCNTTHCQVYRGVNAEDPRCDAAIDATRGIIVTYGSEIAFTPYHSDSGGATVNSENVWGQPTPYLKGRPEPVAYSSPNATWRLKLTAYDVASALQQLNQSVGTVKSITVSQKDEFGRAVELTVKGSSGTARVRAHKFRMALGANRLKSTAFEVVPPGTPGNFDPVIEEEEPAEEEFHPIETAEDDDLLIAYTRAGAFTTTELMEMLVHPEKRAEILAVAIARGGKPQQEKQKPKKNRKAQPPSAEVSGEAFLLRGRGWGHGVGMSQWGARTMAEKGWSAQKILEYYYPGVTVKKAF